MVDDRVKQDAGTNGMGTFGPAIPAIDGNPTYTFSSVDKEDLLFLPLIQWI